MKLKRGFCALGILVILGCFQNGLAYSSESGFVSVYGNIAVFAFLSTFDLNTAKALPPPFRQRMQMPMGGGGSFEDESDEDEDNESQARVEPQITPLNRDECLAKLLCGMSVPVTGGGAPKNGYYSEYANIVAKFFEAFPLEGDDDQSVESIEAYDDYSAEEKPTRVNSKKKNDNKPLSSTGLQLIDLALIKTAEPISPKNGTTPVSTTSSPIEDDDRDDRSIYSRREARARKVVAKLGEKLQTVRQCQKISGCPFTFKQLRSKLKSKPSINSNVPLKDALSNYNYQQPGSRPKPFSSQANLGPSSHSGEPFRDPNKGDDEIEEFFGPPPVMIHRPSSSQGFGSNQITGHRRKKPINQEQFQNQNHQDQSFNDNGNSNNGNNNGNNEYIPYNPPQQGSAATAQSVPKPVFPKKKLGYKIPSFNKRPLGDSDEFDDVNKSTGPVTIVGDDQAQQQQQQNQQKFQQQQGSNGAAGGNGDSNNNNNNNEGNNDQDGESEDDYNNNEDSDEDDYNDDEGQDYNDQGDDYDEGDNDNNGDETKEEEDEEDDVSKEEEEEKDGDTKSEKKTQDDSETEKAEDVGKKKYKIKNYKKPSSSAIVIEEEFPKKPSEDDELEHPDNVWSKLTFAASGTLLKEAKNRTKTKLEEKNDQKLNLSKESDEESDEKKEKDEEEDDDSEEERLRSRKRKPSSTKLSYHDDEEFEKTKDFLPKHKPQRRARPKYRESVSGSKDKSDKDVTKDKKENGSKNSEEDTSEEEDTRPRPQILTQIGGRPLVPPPEKATKQSKKTSGLNRFNFKLVRPFSGGDDSEDEEPQAQLKPNLAFTKSRTRTELTPDLKYTKPESSYKKTFTPSYSSSSYSKPDYSSSSYKKPEVKENINKESYLPSMSFGASNGGKVGTVEYLGAPSTPAQKSPSLITFPFAGSLSSFTRFFKRPGSSSQVNQDIPGNTPQQDGGSASSPFIQRPVGPESSNYKRPSNSNKGRSDHKGKSKGNKKGKKSGGKRSNRY